jgi:hypothetical protein
VVDTCRSAMLARRADVARTWSGAPFALVSGLTSVVVKIKRPTYAPLCRDDHKRSSIASAIVGATEPRPTYRSRRPLRGRAAIGRHARGPPPAPTRPAGGCTEGRSSRRTECPRRTGRSPRWPATYASRVRERPVVLLQTSRRAITSRQGGDSLRHAQQSRRCPLDPARSGAARSTRWRRGYPLAGNQQAKGHCYRVGIRCAVPL